MRCSVCDTPGHSRRACPVRQRKLRALYAELERLGRSQGRFQQKYKGAADATTMFENRRAELRALIQQYE